MCKSVRDSVTFWHYKLTCSVQLQVQKEYRKFLRRHVWLSKCLGCQEASGASSQCVAEGKERRTSLYTGSHGNAQSTESTSASSNAAPPGAGLPPPHGTSVGRTQMNITTKAKPNPTYQGII